MNLTKADRDKLREILAKATFGEWYVNVWTTGRRTIQHENGVVVCEVHNTHDGNRPNAEAIIAAHNALPGLLDALDAAEAEKKRLREALERIANAHDEHIHVLFHYQDEASRTGAMHVLDWAQCIAKAALAEPEAHP